MFTTIVVPIDGSPFSEMALRDAVRLAKSDRARLELVAVLVEFAGTRFHIEKLDEASERYLACYLADLARQAQDGNVEVRYQVRRGMPAAEIVKAAIEVGADLIIMASHGEGSAGPDSPPYGLGGVTFKVLHDAPCPVLVLPIRILGRNVLLVRPSFTASLAVESGAPANTQSSRPG